ncbi:MAG: hypothetical protein WC810_02935 [Janthinobacterium sp.]|jgi:hypothetical protein
MGWAKIFDILDWVKNKIPIQDRLEKIKNDIDKLERQEYELLKQDTTPERMARLGAIRHQLSILNKRLRNSTQSS